MWFIYVEFFGDKFLSKRNGFFFEIIFKGKVVYYFKEGVMVCCVIDVV